MNVGVKYDGEKPRWSLLPTGILWAAVAVMEHGAKKYSPNNWMHVPNGVERYTDAAARHLAALEGGEDTDRDSGLSHVGHYLCSAIFAAWHMAMRPEALKAWRERGSVVVPVDPRPAQVEYKPGDLAKLAAFSMPLSPIEPMPPPGAVIRVSPEQHEHVFELCDSGTSQIRRWVCSCGDSIKHELGSTNYTRHFGATCAARTFTLFFDAVRARP